MPLILPGIESISARISRKISASPPLPLLRPPDRRGGSMAGSVSSIYLQVIDDVISKVKEEFITSGAGESVLGELQAIWEAKMIHYSALSPNMERPSHTKPTVPITPVHDLNVPPVEEYETPTAEMLFPPTPLQTPVPQTPVQTPFPGADQIYNIPTGSSDYAQATDVLNGGDIKAGRTNPYMQLPSPWMSQRPLGVDVNVAYVEGRDEADRGVPHQQTTQDFFMMPSGKRKRDDYVPHLASGGYMPQQDVNEDVIIERFLPKISAAGLGSKIATNKETRATPSLPQLDGVHDEYDDIFHFQRVANEDYNTPTPAEHVYLRAPTPSIGTLKPNKSDADDEEPPLNEDDDDDNDSDDFDHGEEEQSTQHLVLAQFDKVTRTKSRWKCTLKDGIMHINNRDILFNKANGEFNF
ncbi:hypothetical protein AXF42_Ash017690 [Apostasia shenzhenica]|uniref:Transcription initiation factor IIA large subunit n=1 Tax=Apostasia shenzhenica TaxID=1088818 RepID=A0A2I0B610_9ASPA|nr:hypothetical protein AXF42_Ash017690 [Apostasia shenzhenica]